MKWLKKKNGKERLSPAPLARGRRRAHKHGGIDTRKRRWGAKDAFSPRRPTLKRDPGRVSQRRDLLNV